jgi:hypothetical protein
MKISKNFLLSEVNEYSRTLTFLVFPVLCVFNSAFDQPCLHIKLNIVPKKNENKPNGILTKLSIHCCIRIHVEWAECKSRLRHLS